METETKYIYHFIRKDIPVVAQIIQMGHAIDRIALRQEYYEDCAHTVLFEVPDEKTLEGIARYLESRGLSENDFIMFHDNAWPLGNNAIATRPFVGEERAIFAEFNLYRDADLEATRAREMVHIID